MTMRIAHVFYGFGTGGIESLTTAVINSAEGGRYRHGIFIFSNNWGAMSKISAPWNVDRYFIKRYFRNDPSVILRLAIAFKRYKPDLVKASSFSGIDGVIAARLAGIDNVIYSEHGFNADEAFTVKRRRVFLRWLVLKMCKKIVSVSKSRMKWLIEEVGVDPKKMLYIPNGCDTKVFSPGRDEDLRRSLGFEADDIVVGTVGSLSAVKDQKSLLEVFALLAKTKKNLKLLVVGDGPLKEDLVSFAESAGIGDKTVFAGVAKDVSRYYKAMDIFVMTSISENMPSAILEAMATGLPIVATDVGDVKYMLNEGRSGIVVKVKDIKAISGGVLKYIDDPILAKSNGESSRAKVENEFPLEKMIRSYDELYRSFR